MSTETKLKHRKHLTFLSVAAVAALGLSACAPEDTEDAGDAEEIQDQNTADDTGDSADDAADDTVEEDTTDDDAGADADTEEDSADDTASGDHVVYQAIDAVLAEYPDGVITEFDDDTSDDGYVEVDVYDGETEWELEVDSETLEIIDTEDDGIDSDDRDEAEAVAIEISEALQTAEDESGGEPHEGELDTEDGTVVWEFEMTNDIEVYIDVTNGDVVKIDD